MVNMRWVLDSRRQRLTLHTVPEVYCDSVMVTGVHEVALGYVLGIGSLQSIAVEGGTLTISNEQLGGHEEPCCKVRDTQPANTARTTTKALDEKADDKTAMMTSTN